MSNEAKQKDKYQKFAKNYLFALKVVATIAVVARDLHYASTQPGIMDAINGAIAAIVFVAIWRQSSGK